MPSLRFERVDLDAFRGFSGQGFRVEGLGPGLIVIHGPNGAGKSSLVQAMELLPAEVRLKLAGPFEDPALEKSVRGLPGWSRVDYLGTIGRAAVADVMAHSVCGLVTFLPAQNHIEAQPNKLFEYMSAGLPVIASDFPLWRALLGEGDCGLCVDPQDPKAIAGAVRVLLGQPGSALAMGLNGERAVRERYNWEVEAGHLGSFYDSIVGPRGKPTETAMPV